MSIWQIKCSFLFSRKLPKIKNVSKAIRTIKKAYIYRREGGVRQSAKYMVQTLNSEKEKNRKTKIENFKGKGCDFCQNVLLIREYYLSLHGTFNFHIIFKFCILYSHRCRREMLAVFLYVCVRVCARKQKNG